MIRRPAVAPLVLAVLAALGAPPARAADGTLDPAFWGDGRYVGSAAPDEAFLSGALAAPDGALVYYGSRRSTSQPVQYVPRWRRLTDGVESGCDLVLAGGVQGTLVGATFDAAGRLVVGGWAQMPDLTYRLLFARYFYPSCALDTGFDGDGVAILDVGAPEIASVMALAAEGDALVFVANVRLAGATDRDALVGRLLASGAPDPSFSGDGFYPFDGRAGDDDLNKVVLAPGGRIYAGGLGWLPDGSHADFYLLALQDNGTPVPGFGLDGLVTVDFGATTGDPSDYFYDLALMPDGRLLLAGEATVDVAPGYAGALAMITPAGTLDAAFGTGGRLIDASRGLYERVAVQGNGRILIGAIDFPSSAYYVSRRLAADGAPDPTFAGGASVPVTFAEGGYHEIADLLLQDGRVVVAGFLERNAPDLDLAALARLKNTYVFADGFETGATWFWSVAAP